MLPDTPAEFCLAQVSDFHLYSGNLDWWDLGTKRLYGGLGWYRRRDEFRPEEILTTLVAELREQQPDLIAVTGDLTHLGRLAEYRQAREMLSELASPEKVMVIPGNHDAYVPGAWEAGQKLWAPWLIGKDAAETVEFPLLRCYGDVALIGLNSAGPRPWWLATGKLGRAQLARLAEILAEQARYGRARVVLVHHPPLPGLAGWRRRMSDADAFVRVLAAAGAELVLFGHLHHRSCHRLTTLAGHVVPLFGVPAATSVGRTPERTARYNLYHFRRDEDGKWQIEVEIRCWSADQAAFVFEARWFCDGSGADGSDAGCFSESFPESQSQA